MATNHAIAHAARGVHKVTCVGGTEETVTFDRACSSVRVINDGTGDLYVNDNAAAADAGANCERLPIGVVGVLQLDVRNQNTPTVVHLFSSAACVYSVTGSF